MADYDERMMKTTIQILWACLCSVPMVGTADEASGKEPEQPAQSVQAGVHGDPLKGLQGHVMKGIECYKVKIGGEIRYYLLPGTNRNKSDLEIIARPSYYTDFRVMLSAFRSLTEVPFLVEPNVVKGSVDTSGQSFQLLPFSAEEKEMFQEWMKGS